MFKKVRPNIGILNAMVRITCGFALMSYCTIRALKRPYSETNIFWILAGAMKVAEGIVRYCPVTAVIQESMVPEKDDNNVQQPINPS